MTDNDSVNVRELREKIIRLGPWHQDKCFGFDVRDHWIKQARFLAQHLPSDNIEFATYDLGSLPERRVGQFDITL